MNNQANKIKMDRDKLTSSWGEQMHLEDEQENEQDKTLQKLESD